MDGLRAQAGSVIADRYETLHEYDPVTAVQSTRPTGPILVVQRMMLQGQSGPPRRPVRQPLNRLPGSVNRPTPRLRLNVIIWLLLADYPKRIGQIPAHADARHKNLRSRRGEQRFVHVAIYRLSEMTQLITAPHSVRV